MDTEKIISSLHPLERKVLPALNKCSLLDDIIKETGLKEVEVMRALQWLQNKGIITIKEDVREIVGLDSLGREYSKKGLPETALLNSIKEGAMPLEDAFKKSKIKKDELNISIGALKSKAAISLTKKGNKLYIEATPRGRQMSEKESLEEKFLKKNFPIELKSLKEEEKFALDILKKRKDIVKIALSKIKRAELTDFGKKIASSRIDPEGFIDSLTPEMIKTGAWKNKRFRAYDLKINVPKIYGGKRHFVTQAINYVKRIWLDLGFKEMAGSLVQTSFWDLDALFVPQDHPAREMQDTFYIKDPKYGKLPAHLVDKIRQTHENGWVTKSKGWQCKWSESIAKENLLRTHTTVLSAQTIAKMKKEDMPAKFFSVKKVFRNETLSWKSLFEFIQVEGIVVDPDANFKHLKGYLREFFTKMGFKDVRIRPAHFPYTEPSAEIEVLHPSKNKWVELGGSGIFRPEVTKPLIGIEVPVLAWGLGLERSIMEYSNVGDIRDLYKNDLKQLREIKAWMM